ncbi:MAG: nuclear transport factor 2 family protein [Actinomycetota bacterium]|nr:nuclear transport factor 2 family protein [Actinomycetota bacterium]
MTSTTVTITDETQIRELITDKIAALHDRDAGRLLADYTPDVVQYDLAPPLRHVGAEVHDVEGLRSWMAGFDGPIGLEIRDLQITVGAHVAFAHSLNKMHATPAGAPASFDLWVRATVGLRKIDGSWRITHEHRSTPFHMETTDGTFRAATDLTP